MIDLRVLIDTAPERRHQQLLEREGDGMNTDWEQRWADAEDYYFEHRMPVERFDLVIRT